MQAFPDNFAAMTTVSPSDILNCLKIPKNLSKDDITTITPSDVLGCLRFLRIFQRVILPPYLAYGSSSERQQKEVAILT